MTSERVAGIFRGPEQLISGLEIPVRAAAAKLASIGIEERTALAKRLSRSIDSSGEGLTEGERLSFTAFQAQLAGRETLKADSLVVSLIKVVEAVATAKPGTALVLRDGIGDVTLEDNDILGLINLYGGQQSGSEIFDTEALINVKRKLSEGIVKFGSLRGALRLRGNRLTQVRLDGDLAKSVLSNDNVTLDSIFRLIFVTDNIFLLGFNHWLASEVRLTENRFDYQGQPIIGSVVSEMSIYVGNSSNPSAAPATTVILPKLVNASRKGQTQNSANLNIQISDVPW